MKPIGHTLAQLGVEEMIHDVLSRLVNSGLRWIPGDELAGRLNKKYEYDNTN